MAQSKLTATELCGEEPFMSFPSEIVRGSSRPEQKETSASSLVSDTLLSSSDSLWLSLIFLFIVPTPPALGPQGDRAAGILAVGTAHGLLSGP